MWLCFTCRIFVLLILYPWSLLPRILYLSTMGSSKSVLERHFLYMKSRKRFKTTSNSNTCNACITSTTRIKICWYGHTFGLRIVSQKALYKMYVANRRCTIGNKFSNNSVGHLQMSKILLCLIVFWILTFVSNVNYISNTSSATIITCIFPQVFYVLHVLSVLRVIHIIK